MRLLVLVSVCLPGVLGQGPYYEGAMAPAYSSYSPPSYPSYNPPSYPSYSPPSYPSYSPPSYPSYSPPSYPSYSPPSYPSYSPPSYPSYSPPAYNPPPYYETYDTQVDYKEANSTVHCGILPTVHHPYGYEKDRVSFGQYPWQVQILDNYNNYKCAGGLISPRHVITSTYCVDNMDVNTIRVRVGDWDIQTDKNYQEVYKNYELTVCKKHPYYPVPGYGYEPSASYAVVILELYADVDIDQYPHVEPLCLPEFYYLSKAYTNEYTSYSYGYGQYSGSGGMPAASSPSMSDRNEEGADKDLECIVLGYQESPQERISYQSQGQSYNPPSYGYGSSYNTPAYSYEAYENSRTPRRAKLRKIYGYAPQYSYGYGYTPQTDSWEAEYYYDACHADLGSPIFCLVEGRYEEEEYYPAYPPTPPYQPSYQPPAYSPPSYSPPAYSPPTYSPPSYYSPPAYSPPTYYDAPRYKRQQNPYYSSMPSYQPSYSPPSYQPSYSPPTYQPSYSPPSYQPTYSPAPTYTPSYSPPVYEDYYKYPIKLAEPLNREYRRAVLYGVVQYPCQCSSQYGSPGNKITSTPIREILPWIENILHTPPSCASYSYSVPSYY